LLGEAADTLANRKENLQVASDLIKQKTSESQKHNDKYFKHEVQQKQFNVGDRALLYTDKSSTKGVVDKLALSYRRVIIDKCLRNNAYKLLDANTRRPIPYHFHANRLVHEHTATATEAQQAVINNAHEATAVDGNPVHSQSQASAAAQLKNVPTAEIAKFSRKVRFAERKQLRASSFGNKSCLQDDPTKADELCNTRPKTGPSTVINHDPLEAVRGARTEGRQGGTAPTAETVDQADASASTPPLVDNNDSPPTADEPTTKSTVSNETVQQPTESTSQKKSILKRSDEASSDGNGGWYPIKEIESRYRRNKRAPYQYKVLWDSDPPTYSYVRARDLSPDAMQSFAGRGRRHSRRQ
jgi:hypothetical protein